MLNWEKQLFSNEPLVINEFMRWLTAQINTFNDMVKQAQQELIKNYRNKLDDAYHKAKRGHEVEKKRLSAILENANNLETIFKDLPNLKNI